MRGLSLNFRRRAEKTAAALFGACAVRLDSLAMFDGGWLLPARSGRCTWQTDRNVSPAARRAICKARLRRTGHRAPPGSRRQLLFLFRQRLPLAGCRVNAGPFSTRSPCGGTERLRRLPAIAGNRWVLQLEPFDLVGVRFPSKDVQLSRFDIAPPEAWNRHWRAASTICNFAFQSLKVLRSGAA